MLLSLKENYFIRSMLFNVLKGREVKRSIKGTKYQLYFDAGTNFNFFFSREIEIEKSATANLTQLIRKDFLIYDIGANIGYYTLIFSSLCTDGSILAFEPGIENLKYLRKNVLVNQMKNITVIDKALSNKNGQSVFFEDISTGRSSSLKEDA